MTTNTAFLDIDPQDAPVRAALGRVLALLRNPAGLLGDIGEYLKLSHRQRFDQGVSPTGEAWAPNSPRTHKFGVNRPLHGETLHLRDMMTWQVDGNELQFGPSIVTAAYAKIHQFGGTVDHAARSQRAYFHHDEAAGELRAGFVRKAKSNFAMWVTINAHSVDIPARPYLGVSDLDRRTILGKLEREIAGLVAA